MSNTPETDIAEYYIIGEGNFVRSDICRKLERERDEARETLAATKPTIKETQVALAWCASWLDTLSDHLQGRGLAWEMLGELSRKRRENPALDEVFSSIGWTRDAEANFFKARLIPEEGEE